MKVRLLPADVEFDQPPGMSLLDAALRAGIRLGHGCANGSCGGCRARRIDGDLVRVHAHDAMLSEQERADGVFLLCSYSASSDAVIDTDLAAARDIPAQTIETRVRKVEFAANDLVVLHLRTPRSTPLRYHAGQHVRLTLPGGDTHPLAVASCPCDPMNLQFHIWANVDAALFARAKALRANDAVVLTGPEGNFTLRDSQGRTLWFIAFEHGFAPVKSLLEHALSLEFEQPVHVIWINRAEAPAMLGNWLRALTDALDNLRCHVPVLPGGPGPEALPAAAAATVSALLAGSLHDSDVYIAAPAALAHAIGTACSARGAPAERMFASEGAA